MLPSSTHRSNAKFRFACLWALVLLLAWTAPVLAQREKPAPEPHEALNRKVVDLYKRGRYKEAKPLAMQTLKLAEEALGPAHPRLVQVLNNLAEVNRKLGQHADAEHLYLRALNIGVKSLGKNHTTVAVLLSNLALLYERLGKFDEAEIRYRHALKIYTSNLGSGHRKTARIAGLLNAMQKKQRSTVSKDSSSLRFTKTRKTDAPASRQVEKTAEPSLSAILSKLP